MPSSKITFKNAEGETLSASLEMPLGNEPVACALFAHCFTCSKNLTAVRNISKALNDNGYAVLRFDFTGLGESEGDFSDTTFSSNVQDLISAAEFMESRFEAPSLIIGHSLGGAAAIYAASMLEKVDAVATIGAPADPQHITHLLEEGIEDLKSVGHANINIGGRPFKIKKAFLDDLESKNMKQVLENMRKPILIMHSPQDKIVGIDNAGEIYDSAFHPKSFVSLDGSDHLMSNKEDSYYAGQMIAAWVKRYIDVRPDSVSEDKGHVSAELGEEGFLTDIQVRQHSLVADEPTSVGGTDCGPTPYELVSAGLAACTAMTIQMYARRKKWFIGVVDVIVNYDKIHASDCEHCLNDDSDSKIDHFQREIYLTKELPDDQAKRILSIANKCPVHRTLESKNIHVNTVMKMEG